MATLFVYKPCAELSEELKNRYGSRGFEIRNLRRMMQFAQMFEDFPIVTTLSPQLSWSHFAELLQLKEPIKREFYMTMALNEKWATRLLRLKIKDKTNRTDAF